MYKIKWGGPIMLGEDSADASLSPVCQELSRTFKYIFKGLLGFIEITHSTVFFNTVPYTAQNVLWAYKAGN
jgi:hypothetical protein